MSIALIVLLILVLGGCGKSEPKTLPELIQEVRESIVRVEMVGTGNKSEPELGGDPPSCQSAPNSSGTGFVISADGHILTNNHVVEKWDLCRRAWPDVPVRVHLWNNETVTATLVGRDRETDLAVLKIGKTDLRPLVFADFEKIEAGQDVVAIGFPQPSVIEGAPTVTRGIVSAKDRAMDQLSDLIQTDAPINGGNSGGPLLNMYGEVVGVNTLKLTATISRSDGSSALNVDVPVGLNFAVSSRIGARVASDIMSQGQVSRAGLGITAGVAITESGAAAQRLEGQPFSVGVLVIEVAPATPAAQVLMQCDVLEQLGPYPIRSVGDLSNALIWLRSGQTVNVQYRRYPQDKCTELPVFENPILRPNFPERSKPRGIFLIPDLLKELERRDQILTARRAEGTVMTADITLN